MLKYPVSRRQLLVGASALGATAFMPRTASASGTVIAAAYPGGTWEGALRGFAAPMVKKDGIDVEFASLFAMDQIAKAKAAHGAPPLDVFLLDPGPRIVAIEDGLLENFDGSQLSNASQLPTGFVDEWGVRVSAVAVGIAYNPKKLPAPKGWKDLLAEPWVSRLGLTGFQTTFGTAALIEMAKQFGGSITDIEPALVELKKVLPKIAAVGLPTAMPGLFQQGQCDVMYSSNIQVATLKGKGVDIEFVKPESGTVAFFATMHIAKGSSAAADAYKYLDAVISKDAQEGSSKPPLDLFPVNKGVPLSPDLPVKSLDELNTFVQHDWAIINKLRPEWIEKFNKDVAK